LRATAQGVRRQKARVRHQRRPRIARRRGGEEEARVGRREVRELVQSDERHFGQEGRESHRLIASRLVAMLHRY